ncbi:MAG: hypothetical protein JO165_08345 [Candidatus Eremiobacteraeota bacterium]|nr:hypothetical protein [Candidatus Eremiobacteraeota bacterium]
MCFIAALLFAFTATFSEFGLPSSQTPALITSGPAGSAYFATNSSIDYVTYSGALASYRPGFRTYFDGYGPGVAIAGDGEIWFMGSIQDSFGIEDLSLGRMKPGGGFAGILDGSGVGNFIYDYNSVNFVIDAENRAWLSTCGGQCEHGDSITALSTNTAPLYAEFDSTYGDWYAVGPDGRIYLTEAGTPGVDEVARVNLTGHIVQHYALPTASLNGPEFGDGITHGPDGNMWLVESAKNTIARIKLSDGAVTQFAIPTRSSDSRAISAGGDGELWFTEHGSNKLGRISTNGIITEIPMPHGRSGPLGITACTGVPFAYGHGCMWVTEQTAHRVARVNF